MDNKYLVKSQLAPILLHPDPGSELADEAIYGMVLEVLETRKEWAYVQMEYGYKGWILIEHLSQENVDAWIEDRNALIKSPFAEVLPNNTYRGFPIINLVRGSSVILISEKPDKDGWLKVKLHDQTIGFCRFEWIRPYSSFPEQDNENALRKAIIHDALGYIGTHYKWGGKSPAGIDCSGLAFMSHWMNGISIFRDAVIEPGYLVKETTEDQAKPGDLLYFPGHIAVYLGENKYVHSTGSQGGVVLNSLDKNSKQFHEKLRTELYAWGTIF